MKDKRRNIRALIRGHEVEFVLGIWFTLLAFGLTAVWDYSAAQRQQSAEDQRIEQQQVLENTRFARQLSHTDSEKPLSGLNFHEAELSALDLQDANLSRANLTGADLRWTRLTGKARLGLANLTKANLTGAILTGEARLVLTNFTEAVLVKAELTGANLAGANFSGADLTGADLTGVHFEWQDDDEIISGICYDASTVWPEGYEIGLDPSCDHSYDQSE